MAHDVFVSYSSKDKPTADAVCAVLESHDIRCWIAPRDILPSSDWGGSIIEAIEGARAMVLVFSANANASAQIKREVERAVNKGIPVIPLRIEDIAPTKTLEYFISTPHWLDAFTPPLERHLEYLAEVARKIVGGPHALSAVEERQAREKAEAEAARVAEEKRQAEQAELARLADERKKASEALEAEKRAEEQRKTTLAKSPAWERDGLHVLKRRKTPLVVGSIVVLLCFGGIAAWWYFKPSAQSSITNANVDQVTNGMSKKQVESILGPPSSLSTEDFVIMIKTTYVYRQGKDTVTIVFHDDKVWSKNSTLSDKFPVRDDAEMIGTSTGGVAAVAEVGAKDLAAQPADGETVRTALPLIKANLRGIGQIEPGSVQMRVSGLGVVPASWDPKTGTVSYQVTQKLRSKSCSVIVSAKSAGKKVEAHWTFGIEEVRPGRNDRYAKRSKTGLLK